MKKNRHTGKHAGYNAGICLLAGVFLVCAVFLIRSGKMEYPENPLKEQITEAKEILQNQQVLSNGNLQQTENEERVQSEEPHSSSEPEQSEEPKNSSGPEASEEPNNSSKPDSSSGPEISEEPNNSSGPEQSKEPNNSKEPDSSSGPERSEEPKSSEKSDNSSEPGTSEEPGQSKEPGNSSNPQISEESGGSRPETSEELKNSSSPQTGKEPGNSSRPGNSDGPGNGPGNGESEGPATDKIYFTTSIRDGEVVTEREYAFAITHKEKELTVDEEQIYVNGLLWPQFQGRVLLEDGENTIRVAVRYIGKDQRVFTIYRDYIVILKQEPEERPSKKPKPSDSVPLFSQEPEKSEKPVISEKPAEELKIISSLQNQTVYEEDFTFEASVQGGNGHAVLEAKLNGAPVAGKDTYKVRLKTGENKIRLRAFEEADGRLIEVTEQVTVTYVPVATEETRPYIAYINVTDGMTTTGDKFVLDLLPKDYLGSRIYAEGIKVWLNEKEYSYMWANEYTSYDLKLQAGENKLDIRITDKDGRYADYRYTIWCNWVKDGDPIGTAVISVDADVLGIGFLLERTEVTVYQGEPLSFVIQRALEEAGFFVEYNGTLESGFYLSRITRDGIGRDVEIPGELVDAINDDGLEWKEQHFEDSLGEYDYCQGSGWVYSLNRHFTNYSPSQCFLKDGDVVRVRYTLAYGRDVGAGMEGKNYGIVWLQ